MATQVYFHYMKTEPVYEGFFRVHCRGTTETRTLHIALQLVDRAFINSQGRRLGDDSFHILTPRFRRTSPREQ